MFRRYRHGGDSVASLTITDSEKLNAELNIYTGEAQGPSKQITYGRTLYTTVLQLFSTSSPRARSTMAYRIQRYTICTIQKTGKKYAINTSRAPNIHIAPHTFVQHRASPPHTLTAPHTAHHPRPHNIQITDGPPLLRHRVHVTSHGPLLQRRDTELEPAVAGDHGLLEAL